ncbi:hypothetical protein AB6F89_11435 [Providencia hangzhouensis]|uniref:hypothetical protein n=1 Tax=Providencia hangzhouensis TaxID=3031799 RepID=UPI0034DDC7C0
MSEQSNNNSVIGTLCSESGTECQTINLTINSTVQESIPNIDYIIASQYWGLAFTSVISLYLFSLGIGTIIKLVKHA